MGLVVYWDISACMVCLNEFKFALVVLASMVETGLRCPFWEQSWEDDGRMREGQMYRW